MLRRTQPGKNLWRLVLAEGAGISIQRSYSIMIRNLFVIWFMVAALLSAYLLWAEVSYDHGGVKGILFLSAPIWGFLIWLPRSIIHEFNLIPQEYQLASGCFLGLILAVLMDRIKNRFFHK